MKMKHKNKKNETIILAPQWISEKVTFGVRKRSWIYCFAERLAVSQVASYGMELVGYLFMPVTKNLRLFVKKLSASANFATVHT